MFICVCFSVDAPSVPHVSVETVVTPPLPTSAPPGKAMSMHSDGRSPVPDDMEPPQSQSR